MSRPISVREKAILYLRKGKASDSATLSGGNVLLNAGKHALGGPEHTGQLPATRVSVVPFATIASTDVQAALEEIVAETAASYLPWSYAQADGGLVGDGVTDDTVAFQVWIDSETASGTRSAWFWFEEATYLIGGALQDTGAFNGQILLPDVSTSDPQITLHFSGAARPPMETKGSLPAPGGYALIKSTLTGGTGTAACISGGNSGQNNIAVVVEDLICIAPNNPTFTFWNLSTTQGGKRDGLMIATAVWTGTRTQPTNTNAYGIKLPQTNNSDLSVEDAIMVVGFYTGVLHGELAWTHYIVVNCIVGIELPAMFHPGGFIHVVATSCLYGIRPTGTIYTDIWYDAEHNNTGTGGVAWANQVYDIDDPSDFLHGHIRWFGVSAGAGVDHVFTVNGGANILYDEIGEPPGGTTTGRWELAVIPGSPPDSLYADGDWLYILVP